MPAGATADAGETAGEHPTADVSVEFALHELRHHLASTCDDSREGRAVMTNRAMQWDVYVFDVTRAVAGRQRRAGISTARQPAVAARQRQGRGRVHPCTAVSAGGSVRKRYVDTPRQRRRALVAVAAAGAAPCSSCARPRRRHRRQRLHPMRKPGPTRPVVCGRRPSLPWITSCRRRA